MTIIDLFREFSLNATLNGYSTSSRVLYYTLLWCWNEQRRPNVVVMVTKQLCTLTGLPETTFRDAFTYLADRGWVKRVKSRNRVLTAWIMRDGRVNGAPPAAFLSAHAQSESEERKENPPPADFLPTTKETENDKSTYRTRGEIEGDPRMGGISAATSVTAGLHNEALPDYF